MSKLTSDQLWELALATLMWAEKHKKFGILDRLQERVDRETREEAIKQGLITPLKGVDYE